MHNILYLDTTPDISEINPIIKSISALYGYAVEYHKYEDSDSFSTYVKSVDRQFDILYFASHGDPDGVQCNNEYGGAVRDFSWSDLGALFCRSSGLTSNTTILLASCDAGFKRGALILMANCDKINAVAGLPCKMEVRNEPVIFHTFLHNICKNSSSDQIEAAVSMASGQQFKMYKRYEMDVEIALFSEYCKNLCWGQIEEVS